MTDIPSGAVAAIDLGTNSLRLLVLDAQGHEVRRENRLVRLGEGVDASGQLASAALERVDQALQEYARVLQILRVGAVRMVATSAARSAADPQALRVVVREALGTELDIITGEAEAELSFAGATRSLDAKGVLAAGDTLVVDLGGGSTEFVRGTLTAGAPEVTHAASVELGSVRLTERHLRSDPPGPSQIEAARSDIDALLDDAFARVPIAGLRNVVGVAGTVTTLSTIALGLARYDRERVDGSLLAIDHVRTVCERVAAMSTAERMALGDLPPQRADVIGAGALIWERILHRVVLGGGPARTITSEADILDGVARGLLSRTT